MIAAVLLIGLVIAGAAVVVVAGTSAFNEEQDEISFSTAKESMQSFDSDIDAVATEGTEAEVDLNGFDEGETTVDESAGMINVSIKNTKTGAISSHEQRLGAIEYEQGQRKLAYQSGGVFEKTGNGSVVVSSPAVSYRVNPDDITFSVPVVTVTGTDVTGGAQLKRTGVSNLVSKLDGNPETATRDPVNPLPPDRRLNVTIESEYYEAWGEVFEDRVGTNVEYHHDLEKVSVVLGTPEVQIGVNAPLTSAGGTFGIGQGMTTDSYPPGMGYSSATSRNNGDVWIDGSWEPSQDADIGGDVRAEEGLVSDGVRNNVEVRGETRLGENTATSRARIKGSPTFYKTFSTKNKLLIDSGGGPEFRGDAIVGKNFLDKTGATFESNVYVHRSATFKKGATINGDLIVKEDINLDGDITVNGMVRAGGTIDNPSEISGTSNIQDQSPSDVETEIKPTLNVNVPSRPDVDIEDYAWDSSETNNNDPGVPIDGTTNQLQGCSSTCTLESGKYRVEKIELTKGETAKFDTSSGDIQIYVEEYVKLKGKGIRMEGSGDNSVKIYIGGDDVTSKGNHFQMTSNAEMYAPNDDGTMFQIFTEPEKNALLKSGPFYGVFYGAGNQPDEDPATFEVQSSRVEIFGSVVADIPDAGQNGEVHYDEDLNDEILLNGGAAPYRGQATYIQTTARTVSVEDR